MPHECDVNGCGRQSRSRGFCNTHYSRWRIHGSPLGGGIHYATPGEALSVRTERRGDCLIWTGRTNEDGYGQIKVRGRVRRAHRVAYELAYGEIPVGEKVDHTCHRPACVEPSHLRLATNQQNSWNRQGARSGSKSGIRNVSRYGSRWRVRVTRNGIEHRAVFNTLAEAEVAAERMRAELFGDYKGKGATDDE